MSELAHEPTGAWDRWLAGLQILWLVALWALMWLPMLAVAAASVAVEAVMRRNSRASLRGARRTP